MSLTWKNKIKNWVYCLLVCYFYNTCDIKLLFYADNFFSDSILIISSHKVPPPAGVMFPVWLFIIYNCKVDDQL